VNHAAVSAGHSFFGVGKTSAFRDRSEKESRAFVHFTFRPDLSTVLLDNALNCGKSNASSLKIFGPVETLEDAEQLVRVPFVEARAIISHEDRRRTLLLDLARLTWEGGEYSAYVVVSPAISR
jgi:hypothetical protein